MKSLQAGAPNRGGTQATPAHARPCVSPPSFPHARPLSCPGLLSAQSTPLATCPQRPRGGHQLQGRREGDHLPTACHLPWEATRVVTERRRGHCLTDCVKKRTRGDSSRPVSAVEARAAWRPGLAARPPGGAELGRQSPSPPSPSRDGNPSVWAPCSRRQGGREGQLGSGRVSPARTGLRLSNFGKLNLVDTPGSLRCKAAAREKEVTRTAGW